MGFVKEMSEPLAKWSRRVWSVLLPLWVLLLIGSLVVGNYALLGMSLLWVAGSALILWRDRKVRRLENLQPPPSNGWAPVDETISGNGSQ